ncbi:metal-dependent hydrolase [Bacillaceae bacterium]
MKIVYHGHSCVEVRTEKARLLIDPFLSGNPRAKVKPEEIRADYVLLTHGHQDHVADALAIAKQNDATIIATYELATYYSWQGAKTHPMNLGGARSFSFGKVKMTQAFHSSALTFDDERKIVYLGMPGGFLIEAEGKTLYHAGDTGLFGDMKLIGERNKIDVAFLPIGDNFTMGPDDALVAAEWLKAKKVVPIHYNTFPVIEQDAAAFVDRLRQEKGIEGILLEIGGELEL